jgi:DNA-binding CsgD family transcriptional regulator
MPKKSRNEIILTDREWDALYRRSIRRAASFAEVERAKIILLADQGFSDTEIARRLGITRQTVGKWRARYYEWGLGENFDGGAPADFSSLRDDPRSGRPKHPK